MFKKIVLATVWECIVPWSFLCSSVYNMSLKNDFKIFYLSLVIEEFDYHVSV